MEHVDAELGGWLPAPYDTKAEVDASYKALLWRALDAAASGDLVIGVGSHNLFDVALALEERERRQLVDVVGIEMLEGMAPPQARAVLHDADGVLLYTPVVSEEDFPSSIAYLSRRLDENAGPENFLRSLFTIERRLTALGTRARALRAGRRGTPRRFRPTPRRAQDRRTEERRFDVEAAVHQRAGHRLHPTRQPGMGRGAPGGRPSGAAAAARDDDGRHRRAGRTGPTRRGAVASDDHRRPSGGAEPGRRGDGRRPRPDDRRDGSRDRQDRPRRRQRGLRGDRLRPLVGGVHAHARRAGRRRRPTPTRSAWSSSPVRGTSPPPSRPTGSSPPWRPATPCCSSPLPRRWPCGAEIVRHVHDAGVPDDVVQLVRCPDDDVGRHLVTHPGVDGVVLTGAYDTARLFLAWQPSLRLLAETSGKNSLVISQTADVDLALRDLVRSAFGHAGQKCSAASLAIVEAPLYDDPAFLARLADAVRSLRVGPADRPGLDGRPGDHAADRQAAPWADRAGHRGVVARAATGTGRRPSGSGHLACASACSPGRGSTRPSASGPCSA